MGQAMFPQGPGASTLPEPAGPITRTPNLLILALLVPMSDWRGLGARLELKGMERWQALVWFVCNWWLIVYKLFINEF